MIKRYFWINKKLLFIYKTRNQNVESYILFKAIRFYLKCLSGVGVYQKSIYLFLWYIIYIGIYIYEIIVLVGYLRTCHCASICKVKKLHPLIQVGMLYR